MVTLTVKGQWEECFDSRINFNLTQAPIMLPPKINCQIALWKVGVYNFNEIINVKQSSFHMTCYLFICDILSKES